jgi:hypothetical protein
MVKKHCQDQTGSRRTLNRYQQRVFTLKSRRESDSGEDPPSTPGVPRLLMTWHRGLTKCCGFELCILGAMLKYIRACKAQLL